MNTERFARPVNTGVNHTLLILGSAWETSPELGDEIAVYDSENNMVASVAWRPEQEGHSGLAIWGDDETTSAKIGNAPAQLARYRTTVLHKFIDIKAEVVEGKAEVLGLF